MFSTQLAGNTAHIWCWGIFSKFEYGGGVRKLDDFTETDIFYLRSDIFSGLKLQKLRVRAMQHQYLKKYYEYVRGEREYNTVYQQIPPPLAYDEPLRTPKNDYSDGHN